LFTILIKKKKRSKIPDIKLLHMFSFKAQLMPLMYAQKVVNKYLTRCAKKEEGAKDIQINEQQTKIEHQHHTNTHI
jgi:hypothetical protein